MSCFQEDELIPAKILESRVGEADLYSRDGIDYQDQVYYDLSTNQVLNSNKRDAWHLAFSCDPKNHNIFSNSSIFMRTAVTNEFDFQKVINPDPYEFKYERSTRFFWDAHAKEIFRDSSGIDQILLFDLGRNIQNQSGGYIKVQIIEADSEKYRIRFARPDNSDEKELVIEKNADFNNVYWSFDDPGAIQLLEPPKNNWDLLFSRYMERLPFEDDTLDYSVTGVLLNPNKVKATKIYDSMGLTFETLSASDLGSLEFSTKTDFIGHDWKDFDLDASLFSIVENQFYAIEDTEEQVYKMKFIGFYDKEGNKGNCIFEYLRIR